MPVMQPFSPQSLDGEPVSNHDELMSNFFAQPDALALGKTAEELKASHGGRDALAMHSHDLGHVMIDRS
eukprot:Skav205118  [mRNA]  locus=scaffold1864:241969:242661:+ [translate_table: standard]